MKAATAYATLGYSGLLSCAGKISRFGRQARLGERVDSGLTASRLTPHSARFAAITKTEVTANRYRDFGRDNSLQGLMLTHRPQANRLV